MPNTNWVDIVVVIFLFRGGYIGLYQGFAAEIFKILGAIVACVASLSSYQIPGEWLNANSFLSAHTANIISFIFILFSILFLFRLIRIFLFRVLHIEIFGRLENWAGLILGLGRGLVLASLFIFALSLLPCEYLTQTIEASFSGARIKNVAPLIKDFIVKFQPRD